MQDILPNIYQTIVTNFGLTKYTGDDVDQAILIAERCGYECHVLKDGALIGEYSPISGWKKCR
jgi:hypothetical protein